MKLEEFPIPQQLEMLTKDIERTRGDLDVIEAMIEIGSSDQYHGLLQVPLDVFAEHPAGKIYTAPLYSDPQHHIGHWCFSDTFARELQKEPAPDDISIPEHLKRIYQKRLRRDMQSLRRLNKAITEAAYNDAEIHFNEPILVAGEVARLVGFAVDDNDNYLIVKKRRRDFEGAWLETWVSYAGGYTFLTALKAQAAEEGANDLERLDADLEKDGCMREASFKYVDERNTSGSCN